jgi:uncharacterized phosphosugar-binding protein
MTQQPTMRPLAGIDRFTAEVSALVDRVTRVNATTITRAAEAILATVEGDRIVHVAGAGHGLILALEAFYRAGGLACVNPLWRPVLLPFAGARASTRAERMSGLGTTIADEAGIADGDCLVIASQSGLNPVSIDIGAEARRRGATVIAITSIAHSKAGTSRDPQGRRLSDVADVVIDTCVPPGDAAWLPGEGESAVGTRVAPLSTIASCHAWNLVLVALADLARTANADLPIWTSSNVAGGDEANARLLARYGDRVGAL